MKLWNTREELVAQIVTLACQGVSARAIARALGVSRNTVRKLLAEHRQARDTEAASALPRKPRRAPRPSKLDDFQAKIGELLERHPDITAQRVFEDLRAAGYGGGYTAVKEHVRVVRPAPPPKASQPTPEYGPAEMAESDWSPYVIEFTHAPRSMVQVFAYTLNYSTRKHFALYERCDIYALMDGHVATFERFGGAAWACKYDGQKAVVLGWEGKQPIFNPRYLVFCAHYEFRPVACRPKHPNDKPHVERAYWEFDRSFINGRSFRDVPDMRGQLLGWEDGIADLRPRRRAPKRARMELFAEEQPLLRALPRHAYDTARVAYRHCSIDGYVPWNGNRYAVPYDHITDILPIRITQHELLVYAADFSCVARHELVPRGAGQDIGGGVYHPRKAQGHHAGADLDQLRGTFDGMGEGAGAFLDALCAVSPRQAAHQARCILLLRERFSTTDLCAALRHAQAFGAFEHQSVERILAARGTPRRLAEYVSEDLTRRVVLNMGVTHQPRDLAEYDRLPLAGNLTSRTEQEEPPCPESSQTPPTTSSSSGSDEPSRSSG
ncbi:MAG: IS21 family transposase [Deltaproteobacteria bacterium]|nr:IS21 family transposase [Deltaproteobacteria bacterium]